LEVHRANSAGSLVAQDLRNATASYSDAEMHAALDVNIPNYARAIVTTNHVVDALASVHCATCEPGRAGEPPERFAAELHAAFRPLR
jgi:hypothetical protein